MRSEEEGERKFFASKQIVVIFSAFRRGPEFATVGPMSTGQKVSGTPPKTILPIAVSPPNANA